MQRPMEEEIRYLHGPANVRDLFQKLTAEAIEEVRLVFPSATALKEYYFIIEQLASLSISRKNHHPKVRVLLSLTPDEERNNSFGGVTLKAAEWRKTEPIDIGIGIYDRSKLVLFQPASSPQKEGPESAETAILISNKFIVAAITAFFNVFWKESELRETGDIARRELVEALTREERARREAQLLQDILTHDIRNYNQVTKLSVELLKEELRDKESVQMILGSMLNAIEGSTDLLERAKRLGRVISEQNPRLYPVNLIEIIENSLDVIRHAFPEKRIKYERSVSPLKGSELSKVEGQQELYDGARGSISRRIIAQDIANASSASGSSFNYCAVLADDLLNEVFTNLFSNSVKYTDGKEVSIVVSITEVPDTEVPIDNVDIRQGQSSPAWWKITVTDRGHGIPDQSKGEVFSRYLRGARGTGLGMSIVHALVVDRYAGKIVLRNRVEGDCTQGTSLDIWLKGAEWQW